MEGRSIVDRLMSQLVEQDTRDRVTDVQISEHRADLCRGCGYGSITTGCVLIDGSMYPFRAVGRCLSPGMYDDSFDITGYPPAQTESTALQQVLRLVLQLDEGDRDRLNDIITNGEDIDDLLDD